MAAVAYGMDKANSGCDQERNILIFDLGDGSFDISLLSIECFIKQYLEQINHESC